MNTNDLAKLYDRLTPRERLPLIMAAVERGDPAEADRLARAAPRIHVSLPDHHGLSEGLAFLTLCHVIEQLDFAVLFWQAQALAADWEAYPAGARDKAAADRMWDVGRLAGYLLCIESEAWKRLHAELHIGPESLLRYLRGHDAVKRTEKSARALAWTPEEAAAYLRRQRSGDATLRTVEEAVRGMWDIINQRIELWG